MCVSWQVLKVTPSMCFVKLENEFRIARIASDILAYKYVTYQMCIGWVSMICDETFSSNKENKETDSQTETGRGTLLKNIQLKSQCARG